jgi:putative redox protein
MQVAVSGEQDENPPWTFRKLHIHYQVSGVNLKPEDVEKAIQLSEEKYCSVSATLRQAAEITYDVKIIEACT